MLFRSYASLIGVYMELQRRIASQSESEIRFGVLGLRFFFLGLVTWFFYNESFQTIDESEPLQRTV